MRHCESTLKHALPDPIHAKMFAPRLDVLFVAQRHGAVFAKKIIAMVVVVTTPIVDKATIERSHVTVSASTELS